MVPLVLLTIRLGLAGVFALDAILKLVNPAGLRRSMIDFWLPPKWADAAGTMLPVAELAVSLSLIPVVTATYASIGALILLLGLSLLAVLNLARGGRPDAYCFGRIAVSPIGWWNLGGNALLGLALFLVLAEPVGHRVSVVGWFITLTVPQRAIAVIGTTLVLMLGIETTLTVRALRQNARLAQLLHRRFAEPGAAEPSGSSQPRSRRAVPRQVPEFAPGLVHRDTAHAEGPHAATPIRLPPHALAPDFTLPGLDGEPVSLARFRGRPTLILFWSSGCGQCESMLKDLRAWEARGLDGRPELLVVATGKVDDRHRLVRHSLIALDPSFSVAWHYGVRATPAAALIDAEGRLAAEVAAGASAILALVGHSGPSPEAEGRTAERPLMRGPTLPADARLRKQTCVYDEMLSDGRMVVYNGCLNRALTLNPTAALVWESCDGEHDVDRITAEVREVFPAATDVERDVRDTLDQLLLAGMITVR